MGVVYKAEDTTLDRPVALKFLAAHLLNDEEAKARFLREAKAAAGLHHPNICPVHEINEVDGKTFLSMAFIEGEPVETRIERGPLPLKEALEIGRQIAEGLEAAHEKGVVHRDIKPANVMVDPKGRATIMDFGLARLTEASRLTKKDQTMGTVAYMSPEQAQGMDVDNRSDIWSLGVVLYEMVRGQRPFQGEYDQALLFEIVNQEPEPLTGVRAGVPMELEFIVGKCLAKEREKRYQHTDELIVDLEQIADKLKSGKSTVLKRPQQEFTTAPSELEKATTDHMLAKYHVIERVESGDDATTYLAEDTELHRSVAIRVLPQSDVKRWEKRQQLQRVGMLGLVLLAAVSLALLVVQSLDSPSAAGSMPLRKFSFPAPDRQVAAAWSLHATVSPDGRHVVFRAGDGRTLWIRDLSNEEAREIEGTQDARFPFWSPDSSFIGFANQRELKKVSVEGGATITLCELPNTWFGGGSWSPDGESIAFASAKPLTLYEVPAGGGLPTILLELDGSEQFFGKAFPHFLPIEAVARSLVFVDGDLDEMVLANLETGERLPLGTGAYPHYSSSGHIVYQTNLDEGGLWALPFSSRTLQPLGEAFPVTKQGGAPSISDDGSLVYVDYSGGGDLKQLIWVDREGRKLGEIGQPQGSIGNPDLSPDERRVVAPVLPGADGDNGDLWIHDVDRPLKTRFTFDPGRELNAAWTPSGSEITFVSTRTGLQDLYQKRADGRGEAELLIGTDVVEGAPEWSLDGKYLIYNASEGPREQRNLMYHERQMDGVLGETVVFLQTEFDEAAPYFSPDGRFVVYTSNESGSFEVYVRSFPDGTGKWQISAKGGTQPRWSRDGEEIFYVQRNTLMTARVATTPSFSADSPEVLFEHPSLLTDPANPGTSPRYDVANDSERFVLKERLEGDEPISIRIVENWYEEFRDREH